MEREDLKKKVDLAFLSAFYGGMLTDHQRRILSLHCEEDLSLGEIAEEVGISRQAAHETLTRAAAKLTEMEAVLGVAGRFRRMESGLEDALSLLRSTEPLHQIRPKSLSSACPHRYSHRYGILHLPAP